MATDTQKQAKAEQRERTARILENRQELQRPTWRLGLVVDDIKIPLEGTVT